MAADGYPGITLMAADRRLLIGNTNLHALEVPRATARRDLRPDVGEHLLTMTA
ncbi:hypothetical protein [Agromyces italicus]|uniref:hypothetical protein n=1 Tax=Agromyces italicus TaxID=279572 RepID=UPI0003B38C6F|nr:hypothetical protein [Agromyces italicus]